MTLVPAALVAVIPGAAGRARDALAFPLTPSPGTLHDAIDIATANARVLGAIVLAAYAAGRAGPLRPLLDASVALVVGANTAIVGTAIGAYGVAALPWLVHLPLEWAALAGALAVYRSGRTQTTTACALAPATAALSLIVVLAALIETYITPQTP